MSVIGIPYPGIVVLPVVDGRASSGVVDGLSSGYHFYTTSADHAISGTTNVDLTPYVPNFEKFIITTYGKATGQAGAVGNDTNLYCNVYVIFGDGSTSQIMSFGTLPATLDDTAGAAIWLVQTAPIAIAPIMGLSQVRLEVYLGTEDGTTTYPFTWSLGETTIYKP